MINHQWLGLRALFILVAPILVSCANPMKSIEPDIEAFKKDHPDKIIQFESRDRKMRYAWAGNPELRPLLFVHGSPGSWEAWVRFLQNPDLQKRFQLIAIDRPGYGGSGDGDTETSLANQAADIIEVLKFNNSGKPAILVGHSYGGPVIARMVMDYPQKVAGLVFVAASVSPDLEKIKWYQYPADWWLIRNVIPNMLRVCNQEIMPLKGELLAMQPHWSQITARTALIQGDDDDLVPPGNLDFMLSQLPASSVVKVIRAPKVNHFIPWQHPDFIYDSIDAVAQALEPATQKTEAH